MTRSALLALAIIAWTPAQSTRGGDEGRVIALDHLESKGVTAWIVSSTAGERELRVARLGSVPTTRLRGPRLRDVILDSSGSWLVILVEQESGASVERVTLETEAEPSVILQGASLPEAPLQRSGDDILILTAESVLVVSKEGEPRPLFRRDDPDVTAVARNAQGSMLATVHRGTIELVGPDGDLLGSLGAGRSPAFVDGPDLAFVKDWSDPGARLQRKSSILTADISSFEVRQRPVLTVGGNIPWIRSAGAGSVVILHVTENGDPRFWLLHLATGVTRPVDPAGRGPLQAASRATASRPVYVVDGSPVLGVEVIPKQEPETTTSGFFSIDGAGGEHRTAYEESNWDDALHSEEARVHRHLLDRFLAGVQWPFRREQGYEPFFASDDLPFRASYSIQHRGLDVGARLRHTSTGSVAFHAGGTPVLPLYRGGHIWFDRTVAISDDKVLGGAAYRILQEVELRQTGYLLRIHIGYEHVRPANEAGGPVSGQTRPAPGPVSGDDPIGELEAFDASSPSGGWVTLAPELLAAGIAKGNHIHLGTGGIYRSFNGSPETGARKLRWYQERLLPALSLSKSSGR